MENPQQKFAIALRNLQLKYDNLYIPVPILTNFKFNLTYLMFTPN